MQLWPIGLFFLPFELFLQILVSVTEQIQRDASGSYAETTSIIGGAIALVGLSIRIIFGAYGNSWKRNRLEKSGYNMVRTLDARDKEDAVSLIDGNFPQTKDYSETRKVMTWHYYSNGKQFGPVSKTELRFHISSGSVKSTDKVFGPGMTSWATAGEVPELLSTDTSDQPSDDEILIQALTTTPPQKGNIVQSALFFPASAYLADKWWHRLAVVFFWCWLPLAIFWAVAGLVILLHELSGEYGARDEVIFRCSSVIFWALASTFFPSVVYRSFLFITKGNSWKIPNKLQQIELEKLRTSAGGVVTHTPTAEPAAPPPPLPVNPPAGDPLAALAQLKKLLAAELITEAEFAAKKAEILTRL